MFWELTAINITVIALVITIAGVSVKEFACFLADEMRITEPHMQPSFDQTMNYFLIRASIFAFLIAIVVHYLWIRRIIIPVQRLSDISKGISEGEELELVPTGANNEIGELTKNFNRLILKLRRSEELRNEMTADLAHEVRTPLSNITGYLEALKNGVVEPDYDLFCALHGESIRLEKLIEQLHHLSEKKWQSEIPQKQARINIQTVVNEIMSIYSIDLNKHDIPFNVSVEQAYPLISEDVLKQILGNLLDNAIRYAVDDTFIYINGAVETSHYLITISGKGDFIPEQAKSRLFDRFYRVDESRSRLSGGSGLGLSIVKNLVEYHHGEISFETDGHFHTFHIRLPL